MKTFFTLQQLFDHAVNHLNSQFQSGLLPNGGGSYRGTNGRRCPIGALIGDLDYRTCMEGVPVRHIASPILSYPESMDLGVACLRSALRRSGVDTNDKTTVELLSCLQNVNDIFGTWEWEERFKSIARQFGLSTDALKKNQVIA